MAEIDDQSEEFTPPDFIPVPLDRARHDGWTAERQQQFLVALGVMGSVGQAARAVGMGRISAYNLRKRAGAESFAAAWDMALTYGRSRMFSVAMDRVLNGVTVVRVHKGGSIDLQSGPDMRVVRSVLREAPGGPDAAASNYTK
jgi:hypothetical protein